MISFLAITLLVLIIGGAIAIKIRAGKGQTAVRSNPLKTRGHDDHGHGENKKPPAAWSGVVGSLFGAILVLLLGFWMWRSGVLSPSPTAPTQYAPPAPRHRAQVTMVEVETLEAECSSPCNMYIGFKFAIRSDDRFPLRITYPGAGVVEYPVGDTTHPIPPGAKVGMYKFEVVGSPGSRVRNYRLVETPKTW